MLAVSQLLLLLIATRFGAEDLGITVATTPRSSGAQVCSHKPSSSSYVKGVVVNGRLPCRLFSEVPK